MKSCKWLVVVLLLGCFLAFPPPMASVTAEDEHAEHLEREVHELEDLIEQAIDGGREEKADDLRRKRAMLLDELEEREHHEDELEMHIREIKTRRHAIEFEMVEKEMKRQRMELLSNPLAMSLDAIDIASHHMEPEDAVEFFSELLEESEDFPVKQRLRQRLVELNLELDRREEVIKHLRRLIVRSDD
jgi:hypothetical protein